MHQVDGKEMSETQSALFPKRLHSLFACHVSMHGRCHVWPGLLVVSSRDTLFSLGASRGSVSHRAKELAHTMGCSSSSVSVVGRKTCVDIHVLETERLTDRSCRVIIMTIIIIIIAAVFFHCDFPRGKFGLLSPGKASGDRVALRQLTVHTWCVSVSIVHQTRTRTTGSSTRPPLLLHAIAYGGCTDTVSDFRPVAVVSTETLFFPFLSSFLSVLGVR